MWFFQFFLLFVITFLSCNFQNVAYFDTSIVLINTGNLDRSEIANEIAVVNSFNPKVIAIDLKFVGDTEYSKDWLLFNELSKCENLVMASMIGDYDGKESDYKRFVDQSEPQFLANAKTGFINAILEGDQFQTLTRFSVFEKVNGEYEYHFAIRTAMEYDSIRVMNFVSSHPRIIDVDYRDGKRKFRTFSEKDVLNGKLTRMDIEGQIVMLGFLGPGNEDKYFTPNSISNDPDIYGLEYLAYIVAQVLESR